MYQKRHNRVVDLVCNKIKGKCVDQTTEFIKDSLVRPAMFGSNLPNFACQAIRPDILTIDRQRKAVKIIEISVPFDAHINMSFQTKFNKYFPLSSGINALGYRAEVIVLTVGSLGCVHKNFVNGLKILGLGSREAKVLARYISTSAIVGSYMVWKQRCKFHMF